MMKKKFLLVVMFIVAVASFPFSVQAADYDQRFSEVYGTGSYLSSGNARSPIRDATGADVWARVNSKTNQPRSSGTNPHQGTDLQAAQGTRIYPILPGKVVSVNHDVSSQNGYVILNHDINNDGTYDGYYVRYLHIDPNGNATTGVKVGDEFDIDESFGVVDSYKSYPPHLHFHRTNSSGTITYKLYGFYRWVSTWNLGSHLDFLSGDAITSDNKLYISAYACTDNSTNVYDVTKIELYYKKGASGTWTKSTTEFSLEFPSLHRWSIDLKAATSASKGDTIYYYLVAYRANDPTFSGSYKTAFWPQYYEHPSAPLSASYANTIARSYTIK